MSQKRLYMIKIKLAANWDTSENVTERLLRQFKTPDIDLTEVHFVYDDSYDSIVFFNHVSSNIKPGARSYVFPHEPNWSGSHQKVFKGDTTVFGFNKQQYTGNCIETAAHTFYGGRGPWSDSLDVWSYDNLINRSFPKSKNISSVITSLHAPHGPTCLYPQRSNILNRLSNLTFIDLFGSGKRTPNAMTSPKKIDAVSDYRFNISVENDCTYNWITEKFYDAILTDTVPIYYGCTNIKDLYPEDGYILIEDINDIDSIENTLYNINQNANDMYTQKLNGLRSIKAKFLAEYNLLRKIIEVVK